VGLSDDPRRDSFKVASYLLRHGYEILPINPLIESVFGLQSYSDLPSAPGPVEIVDIFRRVEFIPAIVDQAIAVSAKAVWMQLGLSDEGSAARARRAGLHVIMNRCIMVDHRSHFK
jgi:predicted CoA-binding protein